MKPVPEASGGPLRECVNFASGHTWGSVVRADVRIGGHTLQSLPLNVVGDPAAGAVPPSCAWGPAQNTLEELGANGILGVGHFLQDCGTTCVWQALPGAYYQCPSAGAGALCRPTVVPLRDQVQNPVAALPSDNNGLTIELSPDPDASTAAGTVYFGIGTRANNQSAGARIFALDAAGTFVTKYSGREQRSFVDSGANGYFFRADSIANCTRNIGFYCPADAGRATSLVQTASIVGRNGTSATVGFTVDNVDDVFKGQPVLPGLAGPSSGLAGDAAGVCAWGLPFFYGRRVHVLFEGHKLDGVAGPAIAF